MINSLFCALQMSVKSGRDSDDETDEVLLSRTSALFVKAGRSDTYARDNASSSTEKMFSRPLVDGKSASNKSRAPRQRNRKVISASTANSRGGGYDRDIRRRSNNARRKGSEHQSLLTSESEPFTSDDTSLTYKDDPFRDLDATKDIFMKRILWSEYTFKYLLVFDILEVLMYTSFLVVSGMIAANNAAEINTYIYLVAGTIANGALVLIHLLLSVQYWMKRKEIGLTHSHLISTTLQLMFGIPVIIFGWFGIGRWINSYATCCDMADSQPNPLNVEQFNTFIWSHGALAFACLMALSFYPWSIYAHLHPEISVSFKDHFVHVSRMDDRDDKDEIVRDIADASSEGKQ
jgi:hypothetical protein